MSPDKELLACCLMSGELLASSGRLDKAELYLRAARFAASESELNAKAEILADGCVYEEDLSSARKLYEIVRPVLSHDALRALPLHSSE